MMFDRPSETATPCKAPSLLIGQMSVDPTMIVQNTALNDQWGVEMSTTTVAAMRDGVNWQTQRRCKLLQMPTNRTVTASADISSNCSVHAITPQIWNFTRFVLRPCQECMHLRAYRLLAAELPHIYTKHWLITPAMLFYGRPLWTYRVTYNVL